MKISNLLLMAGAVITLASCGNSSEDTKDTSIEISKMTVDTENSKLNWKGMKSAEDFHTGQVTFKAGSVEIIDGNMASGEFTIDMSSIKVTDAELPDDKKQMLAGHLAAPDFFNTEEGKNVKVKAGALENGMLPITIVILGQEIQETVPVQLTVNGNEGSLKGSFEVNFSSLNRPGFQPKEGQTDFVQPIISFELDVQLK
ncbi:MAG: YceI family protein [Bacteroidetes bacterium]|nr:YceI family protein [Bacteroidota bacterium]